MVIFRSYVKLPEGTNPRNQLAEDSDFRHAFYHHGASMPKSRTKRGGPLWGGSLNTAFLIGTSNNMMINNGMDYMEFLDSLFSDILKWFLASKTLEQFSLDAKVQA